MEVVDLCDSEDELPSLAARLQRKGSGGSSDSPAGGKHGAHIVAAAPPAAAVRPPLSAVHNQAGTPRVETKPGIGSGTFFIDPPHSQRAHSSGGRCNLLAGAEALRRRQQARAARKAAQVEAADLEALAGDDAPAANNWPPEPPRPQYHHQAQPPQQEQQQERASGSLACRQGAGSSGGAQLNARQKLTAEPWERPSWQQQQQQQQNQQHDAHNAEDREWLPPGASPPASQPGSRPASQQVAGEGGPPAKKPRLPRRTKEEMERDKALKEQQHKNRKQLKMAGTEKWALQQVKLLVDATLMSGGGGGGGSNGGRGGGSLGVSMLAHIEEENQRSAASASQDKVVNYEVAPLDLAPYKALRWMRRQLVEAPAPESQHTQQMGSQACGVGCSQLEEQWVQADHVMICFQPQELIDAVQRDRLTSLFDTLERRAPGQRHYLLVCGLSSHILLQDKRQHNAAMRAGGTGAAGGAPGDAECRAALGVQQSVRLLMEEFIGELAVCCPRLSFRDVVDAAQAAQHVQLITAAIAKEPFGDKASSVYLRSHDRSNTQALTNHLINNPLDAPQLEPFMRSITAVPTVHPSIAHVLASQYHSLGGLMDALLDPARSDADKERELSQMLRVGTARPMRVGPAAARQLLSLLRSNNPDLRIKGKDGKEEV